MGKILESDSKESGSTPDIPAITSDLQFYRKVGRNMILMVYAILWTILIIVSYPLLVGLGFFYPDPILGIKMKLNDIEKESDDNVKLLEDYVKDIS